MVKNPSILLFLLQGLFFYGISSAEEPNEKNYKTGWHWYDEKKQTMEEEEHEDNTPLSPIAQMSAVQATIQNALDQAILYPNKENIQNYIALQNQMMGQSRKFEHTWQATLLEHPELDYSLIHPTNNTAKQVEYDQQTLKEDAVIRELAKKSGLFFFYRSTCPYCQRFAPIVKAFAESHGLTVISITTDGIPLPEFPDSRPDQGQANKFHVTAEPALFAVNPYTNQAVPIAYGLTSEADLKKRLLDIATRYEGDVT